MDAPMIELKSALASLFQCGQYSDLTIVCGAKRYPVHRILLATRSTFFEGACRNGFREAETGVIDLTEDDAEAVDHMVHYFYHMDYLTKKSLSRRSSQRSNRPTSLRSSITKKRSPPKQLNLAQVEDPLLALVAAANNSMPLTPPADEPIFQNLDASTKMPDTPWPISSSRMTIQKASNQRPSLTLRLRILLHMPRSTPLLRSTALQA